MTKNITKVAVKPLLKNESPIIKNHLTTSSILSKEVCNLKSTNNNTEIAWKSYKDA